MAYRSNESLSNIFILFPIQRDTINMLDERQKQLEIDYTLVLRKEPIAVSSETDDTNLSFDDTKPKENGSNFNPIKLNPPTITTNSNESQSVRTGRWAPDEKILFLYGLKTFGKGRWKKMSCFLPYRSLVQIKSHAQKVLKHQQAGENIFRRLEENYQEIDNLVVQAARQRDTLRKAGININTSTKTKNKSVAASSKYIQNEYTSSSATKKKQTMIQVQAKEVQDNLSVQTNTMLVDHEHQNSDGSVLAAAALCQLSSIGHDWSQSDNKI
mmetsp:Transcript_6458/g.7451  ORF Transcript_6458/g.7451 Transcript_6458/m.7451 type:complete len:270 (-) Transcript_6458:49-858(-)